MKRVLLPTQIEGPNLILKKHDLALARQMFEYIEQDRDRLRTFLPWVDLTRTVEDEEKYIQMTLDQWAKGGMFDYGIFRKSDHQYLGNIGIHSISWQNNRCEMGYWILGEFEGQGFISNAARALERILFEKGFHRVEIHCSSANVKSAHIPKALGFRLEGVLRDAAIENDSYRTTYVFGKLKPDYDKGISLNLLDFEHAHFILYVKDQSLSARFYEVILGRKPELDVPGMTEFRLCSGAILGLMPETGIKRLLGDSLRDPSEASGVPRAEIYLVSREAEEFYKRAIINGAKELSAPTHRNWGDIAGYCLDPDGHVIAFAKRS